MVSFISFCFVLYVKSLSTQKELKLITYLLFGFLEFWKYKNFHFLFVALFVFFYFSLKNNVFVLIFGFRWTNFAKLNKQSDENVVIIRPRDICLLVCLFFFFNYIFFSFAESLHPKDNKLKSWNYLHLFMSRVVISFPFFRFLPEEKLKLNEKCNIGYRRSTFFIFILFAFKIRKIFIKIMMVQRLCVLFLISLLFLNKEKKFVANHLPRKYQTIKDPNCFVLRLVCVCVFVFCFLS